jgi:hypothetical protein
MYHLYPFGTADKYIEYLKVKAALNWANCHKFKLVAVGRERIL